MKYLVLIVLFIINTQKSNAQQSDKKTINKYVYAVRFSPLSILDPSDQNFTTGFEWNFKKNHSVGTDVSLVYNSTFYLSAPSCSPLGFIVRPFYRYYYSTGKFGRSFIQPELFYKQVNYRIEDWVRDATNSFNQLTKFTVRKDISAINFKIGRQSELFSNPNLLIEAYFGLGVRMSAQYLHKAPANATYPLSGMIFRNGSSNTYYVTPNVVASLSIIYTFNKRVKKRK